MDKIIIGIDPGLDGGIAVIMPNGLYTIHEIPTLTITGSKKRSPKTGEMVVSKKRRYDSIAIAKIFNLVAYNAKLYNQEVSVWLEDVHAMPRQGVTSMFSMGRGFGIYEGVISTISVTVLPLQFNLISPITWKKKVMAGQGKEKDAAVYKALQLYPDAILRTPRGALLDGKAEALLIAHYGKKHSI
jgi:crossover junction endodeoxyribonuclease RuvC